MPFQAFELSRPLHQQTRLSLVQLLRRKHRTVLALAGILVAIIFIIANSGNDSEYGDEYWLHSLESPFPVKLATNGKSAAAKTDERKQQLVIDSSKVSGVELKTNSRQELETSVSINGRKLDQLLGVVAALEKSAYANGKYQQQPVASKSTSRQLETALNELFGAVETIKAQGKRVDSLESKLQDIGKRIVKISRRVDKRFQFFKTIAKQQDSILVKLKQNECNSVETGRATCKNGGTCLNTFGGFKCLCRQEFAGANCELDADECEKFRRAPNLGCQNGAKCVNLFGGYKCDCQPSFFGIHCTETHDDCQSGNEQALCGHGKCKNIASFEQAPDRPRFECTCAQGWTKDGPSSACVTDINECGDSYADAARANTTGSTSGATFEAAARAAPKQQYPCSRDPLVECVNLPGSFQCGACPKGYSGNGMTCRDIDECQTSNGGCSLSPLVECLNERGSRRCGACPAGFKGDGVVCKRTTACQEPPNGGCHPTLARCIELSAESLASRICVCKYPYTGSGVGDAGCKFDASKQSNATTTPPSLQASAATNGQCDPNPCENGATCVESPEAASFECICPPDWTGELCSRRRAFCNNILAKSEGSIVFPQPQQQQQQVSPLEPLTCVWTIIVARDKRLHLNASIDTGNSTSLQTAYYTTPAAANKVQPPPRHTSRQLPECNEYLDFGSFARVCIEHKATAATTAASVSPKAASKDASSSKTTISVDTDVNTVVLTYAYKPTAGKRSLNLRIHWQSAAPNECGGDLLQPSAMIASPGFPKSYKPGAVCRYFIRAKPGQRIRLHVVTVNLRPNASNRTKCGDSLRIYDGSSGASRRYMLDFCSKAAETGKGWDLQAPLVSTSAIVEVEFISIAADSNSQAPASVDQYSYFLSYVAEASVSGCGASFSQASGFIRSFDYVTDLPFIGERNSSNSDGKLQPLPPFETRCEYQIKAPQKKHSKVLVTYIDMPSSLASKRCSSSRLSFYDSDPSATPNAKLLHTFCAGNHFDPLNGDIANVEESRVESTSNSLFVVYETSNAAYSAPDYSYSEAGGFLLRYRVICGAVYKQLRDKIHVELSRDLKECFYQITLPPHNSISLNIELNVNARARVGSLAISDAKTQAADTCLTQILLADGPMDAGSSLTSGRRALLVYKGLYDIASVFNSWSSFADTRNVDNKAEQSAQLESGKPEASAERQSSQEETKDASKKLSSLILRQFEGCADKSVVSYDSVWNHVSLLFRLKSAASSAPAAVNAPSEVIDSLNVGYQSEDACGGVISEPDKGVLELIAERQLKALNSFPITPQRYDKLHRFGLGSAACNWILKAPSEHLIEIQFDAQIVAQVNKRLVDYTQWLRDNGIANETINDWQQVSETSDDDNETGEAKCGAMFAEVVELYEPELRKTRVLCPNELVAFQRVHWTSQSSKLFVKLRPLRQPNRQQQQQKQKASDVKLDPTTAKPKAKLTDKTWLKPLKAIKLQYKFVKGRQCGGQLIHDMGVISSPGFPSGYPARLVCVWTIQASAMRQIRLNFTTFELERQLDCLFDYLEIRNGPSNNSPLIGRFCNKDLQSQVIVSHSNRLYMRFKSDSHMSSRGFELEYDTASTGCGGHLKSAHGVIESPNYPLPFAHSAECQWLIETNPPNRVKLTVLSLSLSGALAAEEGKLKKQQSAGAESSSIKSPLCLTRQQASASPGTEQLSDYLEIFDGDSFLDKPKSFGKYCHKNSTPLSFESTGNKLLVAFKSDSMDEAQGFRLEYEAECSMIELSGLRGVIESPGYPLGYLPNISCRWLVKAPLGSNVTFEIADIDLEESAIPLSTALSQPPLDSYESALKLQAASSAVTVVSKRRRCLEDRLEIWPIFLPPNQTANQTIELAPVNHNLVADYSSGKLARKFARPKYGKLAKMYCGKLVEFAPEERQLQVDSNLVLVSFNSDRSVQQTGFRLEWQSNAPCGGYYGVDFKHRVSYFEPPVASGRPSECVWIFEPQTALKHSDFGRLVIVFDVDMRGANGLQEPCLDAYLAIYDGATDSAPVLIKFCDSQTQHDMRLLSGRALVKFYTSGKHSFGRKFKLWLGRGYSGDESQCGSMASTQSLSGAYNTWLGQIKSPDYPSYVETNLSCWLAFSSAPDSRVRLRFDDLDIPFTAGVSSSDQTAGASSERAPNKLIVMDEQSYSKQSQLQDRCNDKSHIYIMPASKSSIKYCGRFTTDSSSSYSSSASSELTVPASGSTIAILNIVPNRIKVKLSFSKLCGTVRTIYLAEEDVILGAATEIKTPNYPNKPQWPTQSDADFAEASENVCVWLLKPSAAVIDRKLRLDLIHFEESPRSRNKLQELAKSSSGDLASSELLTDCLRIYESHFGAELQHQAVFNLTQIDKSAANKPKVRICRQDILGDISSSFVSTGNVLTIVTSGEVTVSIRVSTFSHSCGAESRSLSGQFASPDYPNVYQPNHDCFYNILGSPGSAIQLKFLDFNMPPAIVASDDESGDNTEGDDKNAAASATCDNVDHIEIRRVPTSSKLWSDKLLSNRRAALDSSGNAIAASNRSSAAKRPSSGNWKSEEVLFVSSFDLSRRNQFTKPLSRIFADAHLIGKFCGDKPIDIPNEVSRDEILLRFRTYLPAPTASNASSSSFQDNSMQQSRQQLNAADKPLTYRGFLLKFNVQFGGSIVVGAHDAETSGFVGSPMYPAKKLMGRAIEWRFQVDSESALQFELLDLNLGPINAPCQDTVAIIDGFDAHSDTKLAEVCGFLSFRDASAGRPPIHLAFEPTVKASLARRFQTTSNVASIIFKNLDNEGSFLLYWKRINITAPPVAMNFQQQQQYASIDQSVLISNLTGASLSLNEASLDEDSRSMRQACVHPEVVFNYSLANLGQLTVRYPPQFNSSTRGFNVTNNLLSSSNNGVWSPPPTDLATNNSPLTLLAMMYLRAQNEDRGDILSCVWTIRSKPGTRLAIKFAELSIEGFGASCQPSKLDVLQVNPEMQLKYATQSLYSAADSSGESFLAFDLNDQWSSAPHVVPASAEDYWSLNRTICGRGAGFGFVLDSNQAKLRLKLPQAVVLASNPTSGIIAELRVVCGGFLPVYKRYVLSQVDVLDADNATTCTWQVRARVGRKLRLTVESLSLLSMRASVASNSKPTADFCIDSDYLSLYNGPTVESPILGKQRQLCGSNRNKTSADESQAALESFSNEITIVYKQTVTVSARRLLAKAIVTSGAASKNADSSGELPKSEFALVLEEVSQSCSETFSLHASKPNKTSQAFLKSPNWPHAPLHDMECNWMIVSADNVNIRLDLDAVSSDVLFDDSGDSYSRHLDPAHCLDDNAKQSAQRNYVAIYDGATKMAPLLGRFCLPVAPATVMSTGRHMLVSYVYSGRLATGKQQQSSASSSPVSAIFKAHATVAQCGGQYHLAYFTELTWRGLRNSPSSSYYATASAAGSRFAALTATKQQLAASANNYPNNLDCAYFVYANRNGRAIRVSRGSTLELASEPTNGDCSVGDYLEIRDLPVQEPQGTQEQSISELSKSAPSLGRFCAGKPLPENGLTSPNSAISVHFHTDGKNSAKGWKLLLVSVTQTDVCQDGFIELGESALEGELKSPGFPHSSSGLRRHCRWLLLAPFGKVLRVMFKRLNRPTLADASGKCADRLSYSSDAILIGNQLSPLSEPGALTAVYSDVHCSGLAAQDTIPTLEDSPKLRLLENGLMVREMISQKPQAALTTPLMIVQSESNFLALDYVAPSLEQNEGFEASYFVQDSATVCSKTLVSPLNKAYDSNKRSNVFQTNNFNVEAKPSDKFEHCVWHLEGAPRLDKTARYTAYVLFAVLEVPSLDGLHHYTSNPDVAALNSACGTNHFGLVNGIVRTIVCGNLTSVEKHRFEIVTNLRLFSQFLTVKTKNLRLALEPQQKLQKQPFYRGVKGYFYERLCEPPQLGSDSISRLRSHAEYPNASYVPSICEWRYIGFDREYRLRFESLKFRPPASFNAAEAAAKKGVCNLEAPDSDDLDYIELRHSRDPNTIIARYCIYNMPSNDTSADSQLVFVDKIYIIFVAGVKQQAQGLSSFDAPSKLESGVSFGWSLAIEALHGTEDDFCADNYKKLTLASYLTDSSFASDASRLSRKHKTYPPSVHCSKVLSTHPSFHYELEFKGLFDMEASTNCTADYIQIDDMFPPSQQLASAAVAANSSGSVASSSIRQIVFNNSPVYKTLGRFCGSKRPNQTIVSSSNNVRLLFHSNARIEGRGFELAKSVECGRRISISDARMRATGDRSASFGILESPASFPLDTKQLSDLTCNSTIEVVSDLTSSNRINTGENSSSIRSQAMYLLIKFLSFKFPEPTSGSSGCDASSARLQISLRLPDWGDRKRWHTLEPLCGAASKLPAPILAYDQVAIRHFTVGRPWQPLEKMGSFKLSYELLECGGLLRAPQGRIEPFTSISGYLPEMECVWTIVVAANRSIALFFETIALQSCSGCNCDSIQIREMPSLAQDAVSKLETAPPPSYNETDGRLLALFCGQKSRTDLPLIKSSTNVMQVRFKTVADLQSSGFAALYRETLGEKQGCGGLLQVSDAQTRVLRLPDSNRDGVYDANLDCHWLLTVAPTNRLANQEIQASIGWRQIQALTNDCPNDYLEFRDASNSLIANLCDLSSGLNASDAREIQMLDFGAPFVTRSVPSMSVLFHSDSARQAPVASISYKLNAKACGGLVPLRDMSANRSRQLQNPTATASEILVESPRVVVPGMRCTWHFVAPDFNASSSSLNPLISVTENQDNNNNSDSSNGASNIITIVDSLARAPAAPKTFIEELASGGLGAISNPQLSSYVTNQVEFQEFNVDCGAHDYIEIQDEDEQLATSSSSAQQQASSSQSFFARQLTASDMPAMNFKGPLRLCGSHKPPPFVVSHKFRLTFATSSLPKDRMSNFKLRLSDASSCNTTFTDHGTISSDHILNTDAMSASHAETFNCIITIQAPSPKHRIVLDFENFLVSSFDLIYVDLSKSAQSAICSQDAYLKVVQFDEQTRQSKTIASLCGTQVPNPIFSKTSRVELHLRADIALFTITYSSAQLAAPTTTLKPPEINTFRVTGFSGQISSLQYPKSFATSSLGENSISAPSKEQIPVYWVLSGFGLHKLQIKWLDINIVTAEQQANTYFSEARSLAKNCSQNYVSVYSNEANDIFDESEAVVYCGNLIPLPSNYEAPVGSKVFIKMVTNQYNVGRGFRLSFKILSFEHGDSAENRPRFATNYLPATGSLSSEVGA